MKRFAAALFMCAMLAALSACGGSGDTSAPAPPPSADPLTAAQSEFEAAQSEYAGAWEEVRGLVPEAQAVLDSVTEEELADPSLLWVLEGLLTDAQPAMDQDGPPELTGGGAEDVQKQAQDLREQAEQLWALYYDMEDTLYQIDLSIGEQTQAKRMEGLAARVACTGTAETANGYKAEYTVSVTNWLRASDTESLQLAWEGVGGKDEYPAISRFHSTTNDGFSEANAAVAFGTVSFRNVTEGFDITEDNPISFAIVLSVDSGIKFSVNCPKIYIQYTESKLLSFKDYPSISPLMSKNNWGPVAFMLVVPNAFIPNDPEGAVLDELNLVIGKQVEIAPSW